MAEHLKIVDITDVPDILRLAEEVRQSNEPRILQIAGEAVAVVVPLAVPRKRKSKHTLSESDIEAFRRAAGGWKDLDTDTLLANIYEGRRIATRPPVEL